MHQENRIRRSVRPSEPLGRRSGAELISGAASLRNERGTTSATLLGLVGSDLTTEAALGAVASTEGLTLITGGSSAMADSIHSPIAGEVADYLDAHLEWCEIGPRSCLDCDLGRSQEFRSGIVRAAAVARHVLDAMVDPDLCVYCGDFADSRDHLLPRGWTGVAVRRFVPTVPACRDCNSRIGSTPAIAISERAEVAAQSLRRRHAKALALTDRTDAELMGFGVHLRSALIAKQDQRQAIRRRLAVLELGGMANLPARLQWEMAA